MPRGPSLDAAAATPRLRRGYSAETSRGDAAARTFGRDRRAPQVRSGRFDRHVRVVKPDEAARFAILKGVKGPKYAHGVVEETFAKVASMTRGSSGADLASLVNDASIRAARRAAPAVEACDVLAAFDAVAHGGEPMEADKFDKQPLAVKRRVAMHEAGHALAALVDQPSVEVEATIVPRSSGSGGHVLLRPSKSDEVDELPTRSSLRAGLRVALAGREAEAIALGDDHVSVGASSDLERARDGRAGNLDSPASSEISTWHPAAGPRRPAPDGALAFKRTTPAFRRKRYSSRRAGGGATQARPRAHVSANGLLRREQPGPRRPRDEVRRGRGDRGQVSRGGACFCAAAERNRVLQPSSGSSFDASR